MGTDVEVGNKSWREIGMSWLVNQGASTVLLTVLIIGGGYMAYVMIPAHIKAIQDGYEKVNERNSVAIEKLAASHEKAVDRIINIIDRKKE